MQIMVNESTCTGCGICARVCPAEAITIDTIAQVSQEDCLRCAVCVNQCPTQAMFIEDGLPHAIADPQPTTGRVGVRVDAGRGGHGHGRGRFLRWRK